MTVPRRGTNRPVPRVGFVLEQTLGHVTHADNLVRLVSTDDRIRADFALVPFDIDPRWARVPGHGNWTVRSGLRARRAVRTMKDTGTLDALFVHTQVVATLLPDVLRRTPTVVSLDATPRQYDELGTHYGHATNSNAIEALKLRLHRACFDRARRLVTWSAWTKDALIADYDVPAGKIDVLAPGVDLGRWTRPPRPAQLDDGAPMRILFVGGDLTRKGGHTLLRAARHLRSSGVEVALDIVTREDVPAEPGVTIHHGLGPNSQALIDLYWRADVFCLPTLGDCLPMVLSEAGAAGLPLVSTDVGAIDEIVQPERTGLLIRPDDHRALAEALERLARKPAWRRSLGANAEQLVNEKFNATTNAARLIDLLVDLTPPQ
jgi:glycosyltransferase involved in cell wall biosynthesis